MILALLSTPSNLLYATEVTLSGGSVRAHTNLEESGPALYLYFCFDQVLINGQGFGKNCIRSKTKRYPDQRTGIYLDSKLLHGNFTTNFRGNEGNYKFRIDEYSKRDTSNFVAFVKKLNFEQKVIIGAMCKKLIVAGWFEREQNIAIEQGLKQRWAVDQKLLDQINTKSMLSKSLQIAKRCEQTIEWTMDNISLIKPSNSKDKNSNCHS